MDRFLRDASGSHHNWPLFEPFLNPSPALTDLLFPAPFQPDRPSLQAFKPFLADFVDPLLRDAGGAHRNCAEEAGSALGQLRLLIGPAIFDARLTPEQRDLMQRLALA